MRTKTEERSSHKKDCPLYICTFEEKNIILENCVKFYYPRDVILYEDLIRI